MQSLVAMSLALLETIVTWRGYEGHGMLSLVQEYSELDTKNILILSRGRVETLTFHLSVQRVRQADWALWGHPLPDDALAL